MQGIKRNQESLTVSLRACEHRELPNETTPALRSFSDESQRNARVPFEKSESPGTPGLGSCVHFAIVRLQGKVAVMKEQLTAVFQKVSEGYIAFVEELPGANAQGDTLEEARSNLQEAVQLVLEANRALIKETLRDKSVIREPFAQIS